MQIVIAIVGAVVALIALVTVAGMFLPREHTATSEITLAQPVDSVWTALRELSASESVRQKVRADVIESVQPTKFTTKIFEEKGAPFGGTWTHTLEPAGTGIKQQTKVTITERGWVGPPPFRVIATAMGMHRSMDGLLVALGKRFGETVTPAHR
jgi:hypothetical protein